MALTTAEIEQVRFHLGWGNLSQYTELYSGDGYWFQFSEIVSPYLSTGTETSATTAITAGSTAVVTPLTITGITAMCQLVVDAAEQAEVVTVKVVTATTFTAHFVKAHASSGYPIATMSGLARLRLLLHDAECAHRALTDIGIADTAGLKSVDKQDVVFQDGGSVRRERLAHYHMIQAALSALVRVPLAPNLSGPTCEIEAY